MLSFRRFLSLGVGGCVLGFSAASLNRPSNTGSNDEADVRNLTLKSVQVLFRHGARTPLKHIPGLDEVTYDKQLLIKSVPYTEVPCVVEYLHGGPAPVSRVEAIYAKTSFKGGVIAGMLTVLGKEQAFQLGQRLAKRYRHDQDLIGSNFSPNEVFARATNIQRCIESMQCVVAGLFSVESFKDRDPLVIKVDKAEDEILYPNHFSCPLLRAMAKYSQLQFANTNEFIDLVRNIQKHTGDSSPPQEFDMMQMRDHIVARKAHGLDVPAFLEELSENIDRAAVHSLLDYVCGHVSEWCTLGQKCTQLEEGSAQATGIALGMGRTWNMIVETMQNSVRQLREGERVPPKMYLYSCHDSSLVPLLVALGCYDNKWPSYSADITFELYEDSKRKQWVKVLYCGKDMVLAGCTQALIPFERFFSIVKDFRVAPNEYNELCEAAAQRFPFLAVVPPAKFD